MSLLALGSPPVPAFPPVRAVAFRDRLTDHSGGTAPESHRLPLSAIAFKSSAILSRSRVQNCPRCAALTHRG